MTGGFPFCKNPAMRGFAVLLAALSAAVPSGAALVGFSPPRVPELERGAFEAHPYAAFSELYDSNIYLLPRATGSWIHTVWGGLRMAAKAGGPHRFDAAYDLSYRAYATDAARNNTFDQRLQAAYTHRRPNGVYARLADSYLNTVDPATSELTERTRRWNNETSAEGEYAPENGALFAGVDARHAVDKYVASSPLSARLNRYAQQAGLKAGYKVMPATRAYAAYHRRLTRYTARPPFPSNDSRSHLADFGVEVKPGGVLEGQAQAGFEERSYEEALPGEDRSFTRWTAAARVGYTPLERSTLELLATRTLQESTFGASRFYVASYLRLSASHRLPMRALVRVYGSAERDRYEGASRRDVFYEGGASVEYPARRWLTVGAAYTQRARFSSEPGTLDYRDGLAAFTLSAAL